MTREQASTVILTKGRIAFAEIRLNIVPIGLFYSGPAHALPSPSLKRSLFVTGLDSHLLHGFTSSRSEKSKGKGIPHSITERRVPELIPVLGSQPAVDVSHKPGGRLPLLSAGAHSYPRNPSEGCYQFCCLVNRGTIGVNSLPKTVTRQRRGCDLNPGPSAPESSTLTTRLPSHPREKK